MLIELLEKRINDFCSEELPKFLGIDEKDLYESEEKLTRLRKDVLTTYFFPLESGWNLGDREVSCHLTASESKITHSFKNFLRN